MQSISVTVGPLTAADDNGVCESQKPAAGGVQELALDGALVSGGVAVLDAPRRIIISSDGDDSANIFVITGTTYGGATVSETIAGPDGDPTPASVQSTVDFLTVSSVTIDDDAVGNITVGTNGVAGSRWVRLDDFAPGQVTVQVNVSGTINYDVETTLDDPNDPVNPVSIPNVVWLDALDANLVNESTNKSGYIAYAPKYVRLLVNSNTNPAYATVTVLQSSNGPI